ncbi:MAG: hypothetical protein U9R20_01530 [Thermodesulfobacteriota bacterium]|nr:hypothetical protein [Thermodesulfobacteriota bacterium]
MEAAGQGLALGCSFEQIIRIIEGLEERSRQAFSLDTCHTFVAEYGLRTKSR